MPIIEIDDPRHCDSRYRGAIFEPAVKNAAAIHSLPGNGMKYPICNMIHLDFDRSTEQLVALPVTAFIERVMQVYYPQLLLQLHLIEDLIREDNDKSKPAELAILVKIRQEVECIYQREPRVVFPVLFRLEQQSQKTSHKLFQTGSIHYNSALSSIQRLKCLLYTCDSGHALQILDWISDMENSFILLQTAKEAFFDRFRA